MPAPLLLGRPFHGCTGPVQSAHEEAWVPGGGVSARCSASFSAKALVAAVLARAAHALSPGKGLVSLQDVQVTAASLAGLACCGLLAAHFLFGQRILLLRCSHCMLS